jgi:hypothetical protein
MVILCTMSIGLLMGVVKFECGRGYVWLCSMGDKFEVVDELSVDETSVDETSVDERSVDETSVDEMSVHEMSVHEMFCR